MDIPLFLLWPWVGIQCAHHGHDMCIFQSFCGCSTCSSLSGHSRCLMCLLGMTYTRYGCSLFLFLCLRVSDSCSLCLRSLGLLKHILHSKMCSIAWEVGSLCISSKGVSGSNVLLRSVCLSLFYSSTIVMNMWGGGRCSWPPRCLSSHYTRLHAGPQMDEQMIRKRFDQSWLMCVHLWEFMRDLQILNKQLPNDHSQQKQYKIDPKPSHAILSKRDALYRKKCKRKSCKLRLLPAPKSFRMKLPCA